MDSAILKYPTLRAKTKGNDFELEQTKFWTHINLQPTHAAYAKNHCNKKCKIDLTKRKYILMTFNFYIHLII